MHRSEREPALSGRRCRRTSECMRERERASELYWERLDAVWPSVTTRLRRSPERWPFGSLKGLCLPRSPIESPCSTPSPRHRAVGHLPSHPACSDLVENARESACDSRSRRRSAGEAEPITEIELIYTNPRATAGDYLWLTPERAGEIVSPRLASGIRHAKRPLCFDLAHDSGRIGNKRCAYIRAATAVAWLTRSRSPDRSSPENIDLFGLAGPNKRGDRCDARDALCDAPHWSRRRASSRRFSQRDEVINLPARTYTAATLRTGCFRRILRFTGREIKRRGRSAAALMSKRKN